MNRFYIADTHFSHENILKFKNSKGRPLRSFTSVEEMDEHMVKCWNDVVKDGDTVYHLGDVCMKANILPILDRLNGRKILIRGNHDSASLKQYTKYFKDIRAIDRKQGIVASHIPLHPDSLGKFGMNVHGHIHDRELTDPRYLCVSVERIGYTPVHYDAVIVMLKDKWAQTFRQRIQQNV